MQIFAIVVVWTSRRIKTEFSERADDILIPRLCRQDAVKGTQGSVNGVIQRASSLVFDTVEAKKHATRNARKASCFTGVSSMTHFSLQEAMCELEGGVGCALFPCGAAAVANTILAFVEQGDHILMTNTAYEPSEDFCTKILTRLGVTTGWFDPLIGEGIAELIQPNTRIVFLESPALSPWKCMTFRRLSARCVAWRQTPSSC